jgi:hypothetical protein
LFVQSLSISFAMDASLRFIKSNRDILNFK